MSASGIACTAVEDMFNKAAFDKADICADVNVKFMSAEDKPKALVPKLAN